MIILVLAMQSSLLLDVAIHLRIESALPLAHAAFADEQIS